MMSALNNSINILRQNIWTYYICEIFSVNLAYHFKESETFFKHTHICLKMISLAFLFVIQRRWCLHQTNRTLKHSAICIFPSYLYNHNHNVFSFWKRFMSSNVLHASVMILSAKPSWNIHRLKVHRIRSITFSTNKIIIVLIYASINSLLLHFLCYRENCTFLFFFAYNLASSWLLHIWKSWEKKVM